MIRTALLGVGCVLGLAGSAAAQYPGGYGGYSGYGGGYGGYGAQTKISMPGSRGGDDAWIGPICRQAATFIVPAARKRLAMAGDRPGGPSSSPSPADRLRPEHAGSAIVSKGL